MKEKLTQAELRLAVARAEKELQEVSDRARRLQDFISATRKLCGKRDSGSEQQAPSGLTLMPRRRTRTAVLAKRVAEVLRAAGRPLHVREIVAELSKTGEPIAAKNPTATVAVALARRPEEFLKVLPNTFDLVKQEAKVAG